MRRVGARVCEDYKLAISEKYKAAAMTGLSSPPPAHESLIRPAFIVAILVMDIMISYSFCAGSRPTAAKGIGDRRLSLHSPAPSRMPPKMAVVTSSISFPRL